MPNVTAIIMIGASGAGKSTWIKKNHPDIEVCSADKWFETPSGNYEFDPSQLSNAHASCMKLFVRAIMYRQNVIVDNTNTTTAEISPYLAVAKAFGYKVRVVFLDTPPDVCEERNTKGVNRHTIERMDRQARALLDSWPTFWPEWERVPYEYE